MKITFENGFHNTEAIVEIDNYRLKSSDYHAAQKKLCGMSDCHCGQIGEICSGDDGKTYRIIPDTRSGNCDNFEFDVCRFF